MAELPFSRVTQRLAAPGSDVWKVHYAAEARLAPGQDITVLIADDREANRQILAGLLEHIGFKTDVAPDGRAALDKMQQRSYPLVLMDIRMPEMDGLTFLKEKQSHQYGGTVIMMSAYGSIDTAVECMKHGEVSE